MTTKFIPEPLSDIADRVQLPDVHLPDLGEFVPSDLIDGARDGRRLLARRLPWVSTGRSTRSRIAMAVVAAVTAFLVVAWWRTARSGSDVTGVTGDGALTPVRRSTRAAA